MKSLPVELGVELTAAVGFVAGGGVTTISGVATTPIVAAGDAALLHAATTATSAKVAAAVMIRALDRIGIGQCLPDGGPAQGHGRCPVRPSTTPQWRRGQPTQSGTRLHARPSGHRFPLFRPNSPDTARGQVEDVASPQPGTLVGPGPSYGSRLGACSATADREQREHLASCHAKTARCNSGHPAAGSKSLHGIVAPLASESGRLRRAWPAPELPPRPRRSAALLRSQNRSGGVVACILATLPSVVTACRGSRKPAARCLPSAGKRGAQDRAVLGHDVGSSDRPRGRPGRTLR